MAKKRRVEFVGLGELQVDDFVIVSLKNSTQKSFEKILDGLLQDAKLKVHIKRHFAGQENKRNKYSVVLHLDYSGNEMSINNVVDWDLQHAVSKAIKGLESRILRMVKVNAVQERYSENVHAYA